VYIDDFALLDWDADKLDPTTSVLSRATTILFKSQVFAVLRARATDMEKGVLAKDTWQLTNIVSALSGETLLEYCI
jgi:hypothetical protein